MKKTPPQTTQMNPRIQKTRRMHWFKWLTPLILLFPASIFAAIEPGFIHDLTPGSEGSSPAGVYTVESTDPYVVYHFRKQKPENLVVTIQTNPDPDKSPETRIDCFWETADHGFDEAHKIAFSVPRNPKSQDYFLNLKDLAQRQDFPPADITALRFDPALDPGEVFQFSLTSGNDAQTAALPELPYRYIEDVKAIDPGIQLARMNSIGVFDGRFKVLNGDPYFVFDLGKDGLELEQMDQLWIDIELTDHPQDFLYFEIYWATDTHGYSEAYKAFFLYPLKPDKTGNIAPVILNIRERIQIVEPSVTTLRGLRLDIQYPLKAPFKLQIRPIEKGTEPTNSKARAIALKYTIVPQVLNGGETFKFALKSAFREFSERLMGDPWFSIPFILILTGLGLLLITMFRKGKRSLT